MEYPAFLKILVAQTNAIIGTSQALGEMGNAHPLEAVLFCAQGLIDQIVAAVPIDAAEVHPNVQKIHSAALAAQKAMREQLNAQVVVAQPGTKVGGKIIF